MNRTNIISSVKILIVALFLSVGVGYIFAWTGPTTTPAGGNAAAPISAGSSAQTKNGPLTLNFDDSAAIGLKVLGQIQMVDGNQASGRVLISDGSGVAGWGVPSGGVAGGCYATMTTSAGGYITGAQYGTWGNGITSYGSTYATPTQSANACTCASGYTARVTGTESSAATASAPQNTAFMCVKN